MGFATYRHSFPTCGRPSYPALNPDPLEQEKLFANPEWIIMCFELAYIEKILIINFQFMPTDNRAEFRVQWDKESVMSEESALCDVLLWPQVTICFCKNLELVEPMKNSTCYFAHVWCCVAFPVTLAFWTRCGAHLNVKLKRKRKNW